MLNTSRRYDLDILRVCAFLLLIFYHIGMLYVEGWGFHIKSERQSANLAYLMLLVEPWRMALLWFVSGFVSYTLLKHLSWLKFLHNRTIRLLLPLLFGILVVVPPQLYFEMKQQGDMSLTYLDFIKAFFNLNHPLFEHYQAGIWPHIDVNHLWYLRELWYFTLLLLILSPVLNWLLKKYDWSVCLNRYNNKKALLLIVPVSFLVLAEWLSLLWQNQPLSRESRGFIFLVIGYALAQQKEIWRDIALVRRLALYCALVSYFLLLLAYQWLWLDAETMESMTAKMLVVSIYRFCAWSWLLTIIAYAYQYLNKPLPYVKTLNNWVYPSYILHQSIIIILAYQLFSWNLAISIELVFLIIGTLLLIATICWLAQYIAPFAVLLGMKAKQNFVPHIIKSAGYQKALSLLQLIIVLPLILQLIF